MKTFGDLKIGDELYHIDNDFKIQSVKIDGIRNVGLQNHKMEICRVGVTAPVPVSAHETKCIFDTTSGLSGKLHRVHYYSCLEAAKETQNNMRKEYIKDQFYIAKQAFNRIKKLAPNDDSLKKRIFDFFCIKESSGYDKPAMKVFINKRTGDYEGGMIVVAANNIEGAQKVLLETFPDEVDMFDENGDICFEESECVVKENQNYKSNNWAELSGVTALFETATFLAESGYSE